MKINLKSKILACVISGTMAFSSLSSPALALKTPLHEQQAAVTLDSLLDELGSLIVSFKCSEGFPDSRCQAKVPIFYDHLEQFTDDHEWDLWDTFFTLLGAFELDKTMKYHFLPFFDSLYNKKCIDTDTRTYLIKRYYKEVLNDSSIEN